MTRDDDDLNSYFVAQQIKAEKTRKQEREDHELARLLSSQGSPVPGPSTLPAETNAFTRLMGSQPSGIVETDLTDGDSESSFGAPFTTSVLGQSTNQMPGGYDPTWDATVPLRQASHMPPANSMARGYGPVVTTPQAPTFGAYGAAGSTVPYPTYQSGIPPQNMGQIPNQLSGPTPIPGYKFEGRPGPTFGGSSNASWIPGSRSTPILPSQGMSGGLADIITKTNMFDYTNGMDGAGNALPEHLTNFIQDAYHDPRMTDQDLDNLLQNIRPDMDIPERNRDGTPAGLKRPLYPHQEVALTWMKKMEEGTNKGGILADDMGLGKTISTLALLLSRPATSRPKVSSYPLPHVFLALTFTDKLNRGPGCSHPAVGGRARHEDKALSQTIGFPIP